MSGNLTTLPLARIFWSILAIEVLGFGGMMVLATRAGGHTPEGPVGGWLIFIPPVIWAILALLFYSREPVNRMLTRELEYNRHAIPDELRKALAKYEAAATAKSPE